MFVLVARFCRDQKSRFSRNNVEVFVPVGQKCRFCDTGRVSAPEDACKGIKDTCGKTAAPWLLYLSCSDVINTAVKHGNSTFVCKDGLLEL